MRLSPSAGRRTYPIPMFQWITGLRGEAQNTVREYLERDGDGFEQEISIFYADSDVMVPREKFMINKGVRIVVSRLARGKRVGNRLLRDALRAGRLRDILMKLLEESSRIGMRRILLSPVTEFDLVDTFLRQERDSDRYRCSDPFMTALANLLQNDTVMIHVLQIQEHTERGERCDHCGDQPLNINICPHWKNNGLISIIRILTAHRDLRISSAARRGLQSLMRCGTA